MAEKPPVLVVDDEEVVRVALTDILELYGQRAITASSGPEAITIIQDLSPVGIQVVILDLLMPGMNGVETMYKLIAIAPQIKFIISSGFDEEEVVERFGLGNYDRARVHFLQKPYTMANIMNLVERCQEISPP